MKKLIVLLSALCLMTSFAGCGGNESSSEELSSVNTESRETIKDDDKSAENGELKYYDTEDGSFRFGVSSDFSINDSGESDYEYTFTNGEKECLIGIMSLIRYHSTAKGFSEGILEEYEKIYDNVKGEEMTFGGVPAYRVTADAAEGTVLYTSTIAQYGNGELFAVNTIEAKSSDKCLKQADNILNNVEFLGEPLKTEPETFENDYFSITLPPELYVRKSNGKSVSVGKNLQNSTAELLYTFSFEALTDETDIKAAADAAFEKLSRNDGLERDSAEILGYNAESIKYQKEIDGQKIYMEHYFFEVNGVCIRLVKVCSESMLDAFETEMKPVMESVIIN